MTHLSDFSYLQRCALEVYMGVFLMYRIWANDRMKCLHPKRVFSGELRSVITVLYIMMLIMQTSWDVISTWIKYTEKFMVIPSTGHIITKPFDYWSDEHKTVAQAIDYVECVNLSMQTGVFFLLQCFWNYLSNTVAKKSFMSSREFRFYIFWALGSVAVFPILQWYYRNDENLRETAPQLAYSIEVIITSLLGVRSHLRFKRILNISRNLKHGGSAIVEKLAYFKDMNMYLTVVLFFYGASLAILCVDGLTTAKTINSNKFASDLLIANCNMGSVLIWIVGISIFHPRRSNADIEASVSSRSLTGNPTTDTEGGRFHPSSNGADPENQNGSSMMILEATNGNRLSQRITNFIENKNAGTLRFNNNSRSNDSSTLYEHQVSKEAAPGFLRPMSPVEVDYPLPDSSHHLEQTRSFTPTHHFSGAGSPINEKRDMFAGRNVSIDDPYSSSAVSFTMMDPASAKSHHLHTTTALSTGRPSYEASTTTATYRSMTTPTQDYPMQTMSGAALGYRDNIRFDPDEETFDYIHKNHTNNTNNFI